MASADLEFQAILFSEITAVAGGVTVTAHAKPGETLPMIVIGQSEAESTVAGNMLSVHVHVWDNSEGPHVVKDLQDKIQTAMEDGNYTGANYSFCINVMEFATCFIDEDNETWHGVQRFKVLASPL